MSVSNVGGRRFYITGSDTVSSAFDYLTGPGDRIDTKWTVRALPAYEETQVAFVDMGLNTSSVGMLARQQDWLNLAADGRYFLNLAGVEYLDADLNSAPNVDLTSVGKNGFTTNGSLRSIRMAEGNQQIVYLTAERDSSIFVGAGFDKITFDDIPDVDVPGRQFWAIVRREFGSIDAYNLYTGYRVRIEGGAQDQLYVSGKLNYGELEVINTFLRDGSGQPFEPGSDLPNGGNRGSFSVIDLSNEALNTYTDRFNSASFGSIRFSTQNLYVGQATIESFVTDNTVGSQSTPLTLTSNGVKDLMVSEQTSSIDGHLRLYVRNAASGVYNRFNEVFLGDASFDNNSNNYSTTSKNDIANDPHAPTAALGGGVTKVLGTAMYGFGGNDSLTGGSDTDYMFGGTSTYSQLSINPDSGNRMTGGDGTDYFGVGNISAGANNDNIMTTDFTARLSGSASGASAQVASSKGSTHAAPTARDTFDVNTRVATDLIRDWTYGDDYLRVLANGTAVIEGLGTANGTGLGGYVLDTIGGDAEIIRLDSARVVNQGKIVALGLGGNDTIYGSSGIDYVYGGLGAGNFIYLNNDGSTVDRAYVDQFIGRQNVELTSNDNVYLNIDVLRDAAPRLSNINPHLTFNPDDPYNVNSWVNNAVPSSFSNGRAPTFGLDLGILNLIYVPWTETYLAQLRAYVKSNGAWSNFTHNAANLLADIALGVAGGVAIAAGTAMIASIFLAAPGAVLVAFGASQIAAVITSEPHQNAQYYVPYDIGDYYVNYLTAQKGVNTTVGSVDTPLFTSFFWNNIPTTFKKAVEFTNTNASLTYQGITSYMVVRSDDETFVYYVQSEDSIVTDDEARLVAELSGHVDISQFFAYKGTEDIYNQNAVAPVYPSDATLTADPSPIPTASGRISDRQFTVTVTLGADPTTGDTITLFLNGANIQTFNAEFPGGVPKRVYTRSVDLNTLLAIQADRDNSVTFVATSASSQGFSSDSNALEYIIDLAAPSFDSVLALDVLGGTGDQLSATVSGSGISASESAVVLLTDLASNNLLSGTSSVTVTSSGSVVAVPVEPRGAATDALLKVRDVIGNFATYRIDGADAIIYVGTDGADAYNRTAKTTGEVIFTFNGNDTILAGGGSDQIIAEDGDDSVNGNGGADLIFGGAGNDTLNGGNDGDTLEGGAGNDTLDVGGGATDVVIVNSIVGAGSDSGRVGVAGMGNDIGGDTIAGTFTFGTDIIRVVGTSVGNFNHATGTEIGTAGATDDGLAADSFSASTGLINLDSTGAGYTDGGDIVLTFVTPANNSALFRSSLQYNLTGSGAANTIVTGELADTVDGGDGNDAVSGGDGNDSLTGGAGDDTVSGGTGADTITGGTGVDALTGGANADTFVFAAGDNGATPSNTVFDQITDYQSGVDFIDFGSTFLVQYATVTTAAVGTAGVDATGVVTFVGADDTLMERITAVASALGTAQAGSVLIFGHGGDSYIFITDGTTGIGANDVLIKLTGVAAGLGTDTLTIVDGDITGLG